MQPGKATCNCVLLDVLIAHCITLLTLVEEQEKVKRGELEVGGEEDVMGVRVEARRGGPFRAGPFRACGALPHPPLWFSDFPTE